MAREFDDLKDGTVLEPFHLNIIYRELRRLRKMGAAPPLALENMNSTTAPPRLWTAGGSPVSLWVKSDSSSPFAGASGAWPTITPTEATLDVYADEDGTMTLVDDAATIRWYFKDACGANKLVFVVPNADGSYDAVVEACTVNS